ncbi:hypothetical protein Drose_25380 [Dactylosporangium roseum]|uniref:IrrE N-terminal-like domain-containing protein n=1 Tax=Dactylosporangium roseum TaxID=47989 RepID=A0ABY5Z211_9ACTN|nr:hypothetical protein [Dactylosporangium roseum]UWZ34544.1 hypothetical protein Drose_25380 [Dactylosporangium roseum]
MLKEGAWIRGGLPWHLEASDPLRHLSVIHYLLRSAVVLGRDVGERELKQFRQYSQVCYSKALNVGLTLERYGLPLPPWAERTDGVMKGALRELCAGIDQVKLVPTWETRLHARSFSSQKRIEVSAVTREYLRTLNLLLWNGVHEVTEGGLRQDEVLSMLDYRAFMPYLLSLYRDLEITTLPIPRANSRSALRQAQLTTALQLNFIMAHEYAHIALHANLPNVPSQEAEREADSLAYRLVLGTSLPGDVRADVGDVFTALRWLYGLLKLDRIVGGVVNEVPVDWKQESIADRESLMYDLMSASGVTNGQGPEESIGTVILMQAKADMRRLDSPAVKALSEEMINEYGRKRLLGTAGDEAKFLQAIFEAARDELHGRPDVGTVGEDGEHRLET